MKPQDFGYRAAVFAGLHASVFTFSLHIQSTVRFLSWVGIFLMVARDPDLQAQSYVDQGLDASDEGNPALAHQYLDQALILDPNHAQAWYCKASLLAETGQFEEAIECYHKSAERAEDHAHLPLFNMGNLYQELQKYDQALACFSLATEVNPDMADAWINRGRLLDERAHHLEAIDCYDQALTLNPLDLTAWTNRGNSYVALRKILEAQRSYQKALDIDDSDALAQLGAAVCIARLGEWERGLEMMDQIDELRTSPLWMMERAQILVHLERWSEAVNLVNQAVEAAPDFPESWSMHGNILELAGEYDQALASFKKALEYDSRHAAAWWGQVRMLARDEVNEAVVAGLRSFFDCAGNDHEDYDAALKFAEKHGIPISGAS